MIDILIEKIVEKGNPTVAGLDPKLDYLPKSLMDKHFGGQPSFEAAAGAILEYNFSIIDNIYDIVPAVKLQIAYYEMYGLPGIKTFMETADYARSKGLLVIGDVKRNDIGSTAKAYSNAFIGQTLLEKKYARAFPLDMITINPYFGSDGVMPFIEDCKAYDKGIFILVKTSNPSSGEFQNLVTEKGSMVYEEVGAKVREWGGDLLGKYGYSSVGAVVGATYPNELDYLRTLMEGTFFLVPGYGAQGARAEDIIGGFDKRGLGSIINASRSIICAYRSEKWKEKFRDSDFGLASRAEAINMRDDIYNALKTIKGFSDYRID